MDRTTTWGDFTVKRMVAASVAKVFNAFADKQAKEQWFKGPTDQDANDHRMDFREGGEEFNSGTFHDGTVHKFVAHYYDIVPNQRIVYAYEMYLNDERISVSLATIEFMAEGDSTHVKLHESGAFLDGFDKPEIRERGTHELLDAMVASVSA